MPNSVRSLYFEVASIECSVNGALPKAPTIWFNVVSGSGRGEDDVPSAVSTLTLILQSKPVRLQPWWSRAWQKLGPQPFHCPPKKLTPALKPSVGGTRKEELGSSTVGELDHHRQPHRPPWYAPPAMMIDCRGDADNRSLPVSRRQGSTADMYAASQTPPRRNEIADLLSPGFRR